MSDIPMILDRVGTKLVAETAQLFEGHYAAGTIIISGLISTMAGEAFDGAVDRLVGDIKTMAALLRDGGVDPGSTDAPSLKISDLQPVHDRLSAALIDLQVRLETEDTETSTALNGRIWSYFMAAATARMPSPPDFADAREQATERLRVSGQL